MHSTSATAARHLQISSHHYFRRLLVKEQSLSPSAALYESMMHIIMSKICSLFCPVIVKSVARSEMTTVSVVYGAG